MIKIFHKHNPAQDRFTLGCDENIATKIQNVPSSAWKYNSDCKYDNNLSLSEECEDNIRLSDRSSIHKIMTPSESDSTINKFSTGPCKFISEINCKTVPSSIDSKIKLSKKDASSIKTGNCRASRNEFNAIQKSDVNERISKINLSLSSIFENIYESCNGKIAEFSFCNNTENDEEITQRHSYHRFESMLTQISNIVSSFESCLNLEKSINNRQSVSPESGAFERNTQKIEDDKKDAEESKKSKIHKTKLSKNINNIQTPSKHLQFCLSQPTESLCQSFNSHDEKHNDNNYTAVSDKYSSKISESGSLSKMHKIRLLSSHKGSMSSIEASPFKFKKLGRFGTESSEAKSAHAKSVRNNSKLVKQGSINSQNDTTPVSLIQTYFPVGVGRNYND